MVETQTGCLPYLSFFFNVFLVSLNRNLCCTQRWREIYWRPILTPTSCSFVFWMCLWYHQAYSKILIMGSNKDLGALYYSVDDWLSCKPPSWYMRVEGGMQFLYNANVCTILGVLLYNTYSLWMLIPVFLHLFWNIHRLEKCRTDCTSEGVYSDFLGWKGVTSWHPTSSQPIYWHYVLQITTTKHSSFQNFDIAKKTDWSCPKNGMMWSHRCDTTIWTR